MSTVAFLSAAPFLHAIFAALGAWGGAVPALVHAGLHLAAWGGAVPADSWGALVVG
jgi:hypothetical protein